MQCVLVLCRRLEISRVHYYALETVMLSCSMGIPIEPHRGPSRPIEAHRAWVPSSLMEGPSRTGLDGPSEAFRRPVECAASMGFLPDLTVGAAGRPEDCEAPIEARSEGVAAAADARGGLPAPRAARRRRTRPRRHWCSRHQQRDQCQPNPGESDAGLRENSSGFLSPGVADGRPAQWSFSYGVGDEGGGSVSCLRLGPFA